MKKSLYFPTAFRGTGLTPQVRQFDGVHLVALRSRLELHDCIPLLSEFQFFFCSAIATQAQRQTHSSIFLSFSGDGHAFTESANFMSCPLDAV